MRTSRHAWWLAGVVSGAAGLATSYFVAMVMSIREAPLVAVAEAVIRHTPGGLAERAIQTLGHHDKQVLVGVILVVLVLLFAWAGRLARRSTWPPLLLFLAIAVLGAMATLAERGARPSDLLPIVVGFITWVVCFAILTDNLRAADRRAGPDAPQARLPRRAFIVSAGLVAVGSAGVVALGQWLGAGRRQVEQTRQLLRLPGVTYPDPPAGVSVDLPGVAPWRTSEGSFYLVHTALIPPAIEPASWQLRIHGLVEKEITLTYAQLVARQFTEAWITLNCVSNPVGGSLIGNAWWSGVRLADLLAEAGVASGADCVLQTSDDGWTCSTPLTALTDDRDAMLAVAMNGQPLPIDHGFPVRTLVPGLYGYVSACKWVVDMELTTFEEVSAYWTQRGWAEQAPVKMSSRIDVPRGDGEVDAGSARVGGVAWAQHTGISAVEVSLDGGGWQSAQIGNADTIDAWVQWTATLDVAAGDHTLRVRATDTNGQVQTGAVADVLPDGATGWHTVDFTAV